MTDLIYNQLWSGDVLDEKFRLCPFAVLLWQKIMRFHLENAKLYSFCLIERK